LTWPAVQHMLVAEPIAARERGDAPLVARATVVAGIGLTFTGARAGICQGWVRVERWPTAKVSMGSIKASQVDIGTMPHAWATAVSLTITRRQIPKKSRMRIMAERGQTWVGNPHESWTIRTVTPTGVEASMPTTNEGSVHSSCGSNSPSLIGDDVSTSSPSSRPQSHASGTTTSEF
jgi:hypothetical protein